MRDDSSMQIMQLRWLREHLACSCGTFAARPRQAPASLAAFSTRQALRAPKALAPDAASGTAQVV